VSAQHLRWGLDRLAWCGESIGAELDPWQARALSTESRRLCINVHRQGGKSFTMSLLGAHEALFFPQSLTLIVSPSESQSLLLMRAAKQVLERSGLETQPTTFPHQGFHIDGGGDVVALPGVSATTRGYSACTLLLVDEAAQVKEADYKAVRPFLATTNGREVMASTPFGARGFFWETCEGPKKRPRDGYEYFKALGKDCPRISAEFLEEERRSLGEWYFRQEYEGVFCDVESGVFNPDAILEAMSDEVEAYAL
jgi:hypothetical protein